MKDKHDTDTLDMYEQLGKPVLTQEQVEDCLNVADRVMLEYPEIRLGQAFLNAVWSEYQISCTWPELFYEKDTDKAYGMIVSEYFW